MIILTEIEKQKIRDLHKAYSLIKETPSIVDATPDEFKVVLQECITSALDGDADAGSHLVGWLPIPCLFAFFNRSEGAFNPIEEPLNKDGKCLIAMQKLLRDEEEGPEYFQQFMVIANDVIDCLEEKGKF